MQNWCKLLCVVRNHTSTSTIISSLYFRDLSSRNVTAWKKLRETEIWSRTFLWVFSLFFFFLEKRNLGVYLFIVPRECS